MLALLIVLVAVHSACGSTACVETGQKANYSSFCALTSDRNHPRQSVRHMGRFNSRQQSRQPPMRLLPSLILIGSIKAGTTTLWSALVDSSDGAINTGGTTHKGAISRKEKDFFGDPSQWRRGGSWYERAWSLCSRSSVPKVQVAIDATPAYHVWYDAPMNMRAFFGDRAPQIRLLWVMREPIEKFWSYFWELKSYGGDWDSVSFPAWVAPKLAAARACLAKDGDSPLWPPSLPPPFTNCAPHLDHGLYYPQLRRWLEFFSPSQLLVISFAGFTSQPTQVVRDVILHAGLPDSVARATAERVAAAPVKKSKHNSRARGRGHMSRRIWRELHALYSPFVEKLYTLMDETSMKISPCEKKGTRFLDPANETIAEMLKV